MKKRSAYWTILLTLLCCGAMALVDGVLRPGYGIKSAVKLTLFLGAPFLLAVTDKTLRFRQLFRLNRRTLPAAVGLGLLIYGGILGAYFGLRPFFDFSGIADKLSANAGVNRGNFLWVSLYISFVNSLLEEFFFRGFVFQNLKNTVSRGFAYGFSSICFAAYHVAMMLGWFSPVLFLLAMAGLAAGGCIFNWLNEKTGSVYCSWLIHMFANFAINTVGFLLL